ncbi:MAG: chloride channel protein [Flavobacteriaceae bacterium]|nr:chloride channel protein [Flavobacteriaceae bacterium]
MKFRIQRQLIKIQDLLNHAKELRFTHRQFIYLLATLIGIISGFYALLIVKTTTFVNEILVEGIFKQYSIYYFIFPALGLFFTFLVIKLIIRIKFHQGMSATLLAITNRGIFKEKKQTYISLITVPFTVGLGGSAGLEGPTVVSTAAASSAISKYFKLDQKTRTLLIGCAAVGAMSSLFKAPMAAIVFAIEVFALDFTLGSMVPLLISSVSAILTSYFFSDNEVLFPVRIIGEFYFEEIPYFMLLGLFCGLTSVFFTYFYNYTESFFKKFKKPIHRILLGGLLIGVIVYFFPPIFGEGAEAMNMMLRGEGEKLIQNTHFEKWNSPYVLVGFILSISILKTIATATTLGSGGVGGIFGPLLFIGCAIGNGFAKILNILGFDVNETNFTLVGMAGSLAGVLHAPLTAIFLIAEISNGYNLIVPIMMTVAIAFAINRYYFKVPFYKMELEHRGELTTHDRDEKIVRNIDLKEVVETSHVALYNHQTLEDLIKNLEFSNTNIFPVLDQENHLKGVINVSEIYHLLYERKNVHDTPITEFMSQPRTVIYYEKDNIKTILDKFDETDSWLLPVVRNEVYYGIISKSRILNLYRIKLKNFDFD